MNKPISGKRVRHIYEEFNLNMRATTKIMRYYIQFKWCLVQKQCCDVPLIATVGYMRCESSSTYISKGGSTEALNCSMSASTRSLL